MSLNLSKIRIRGKSGIHGKDDFKTSIFSKDMFSRSQVLTFRVNLSHQLRAGNLTLPSKFFIEKLKSRFLTMRLNLRKSESAENLESTEKMTLRLVSFHKISLVETKFLTFIGLFLMIHFE